MIDDAEDFNLVMSMYNLIEYSSDYSKDEATNLMQILLITIIFMYKAKLLENIVAHDAQNQANGILKNATLAVPLKYLSNFWRSLEMPLINCKVELKFRCTNYCVLSAVGVDNVNNRDSNNTIFTIKDI